MIEIAPIVPADVDNADQLLHALYPGSDRRFAPDLRNDGVDVLLAKESDQALGLVTATFVHDGWEPYGLIDQLIVYPEYRMRGIGRRLVSEACNLLVKRGAIVVFVTTNNGSAEHFYRQVGFAATGPWLAWAPGNPLSTR